MGHILNLDTRLSIWYMYLHLKVPIGWNMFLITGCSVLWFSGPPFCFYPQAFLKKAKGDIVIASVRLSVRPSVRPSVCPLCYLLLNCWTKFNQIWCVSYWHEWGVQNQTFFGPAPWGPWEESKGQISFNFNYKVNFKDFYTKLCVCSHKWKIQNISDGIFILSTGSCPRGGTSGRWGAQGVNFFSNMVMWYIK